VKESCRKAPHQKKPVTQVAVCGGLKTSYQVFALLDEALTLGDTPHVALAPSPPVPLVAWMGPAHRFSPTVSSGTNEPPGEVIEAYFVAGKACFASGLNQLLH
jgi:hypothetical protein